MAVSTGAAILGAAGVGAVASLIGGKQSSNAAQSAAQTQADAANQATAAQQSALERQLALQQPFTTAGTTAVNQLSALTQPGGRLTQDFVYGPNAYQADPGYAFRLREGMNAMNATAAARGGLISGNALRAGQMYGQELGSQEYQNAFNRAQNTFQMNRNNLINPLQFLTGIGQAGASNQAANVGNYGTAQAANITGGANALAAGQIGSANAYGSALGGVGNAAQTAAMMSLYGGNRSAYGSSSSPEYYSGMNAELGL